ncbi:MAG: glycosyltransferase [Phycisphaerales bacterium]|nr:MAG: glycosyltransferase [Phycisphaerales bacterium]
MRGTDVICFGGEDWWYHNRGHIDMQLMRRFAKMGTVIYVNSIVMQKPNLAGGRTFLKKLTRKSKSIFRGLKKSGVGFWVYSPLSLPVHHIALGKLLNDALLRFQLFCAGKRLHVENPLLWVACPPACGVALKMRKTKLVYQRTDRLEEFPGVDSALIERYDRKLKSCADLTIFVNEALYNQEHSQCKKAMLLDHGVDFEMFAHAEKDGTIPDELRDMKRPIVGFYGGIDDHTFDIGFMEQVVDLLPEMSFVFVGAASSDCSALMSRKNVWMLGQKPYEQIPHYGKCFDVAIMPWRQNRWIDGCNPIKLKEYLALGKPVVSTPFPELSKYKDVTYEAKTPEEFARCIQKAHNQDNAELVAQRRAKVALSSWDSKAESALRELFAGGQSEPGPASGEVQKVGTANC